jgi:hydroxymethylpyrimidine/phosphomethylpyrimidine kinase
MSALSLPRLRCTPCALAIGGLDPGGGAGVLADVRAFEAAGAFGCAAVAVVTVQSTAGLRRVQAVDARLLVQQAEEVLANQRVRAIKVGALGTAANVRVVAKLLARYPDVPVVIDTPMAPTRGRERLLLRGATQSLRDDLLRRATLVTANAEEAGALLGCRVRTVSEAHDAARALVRLGARAALVKGGHLASPSGASSASAVDVFALAEEVIEVRARRLSVGAVHGTGCALASLIAGRLAARSGRGRDVGRAELVGAIRWAKRVHHAALARAADVGRGMRVLAL